MAEKAWSRTALSPALLKLPGLGCSSPPASFVSSGEGLFSDSLFSSSSNVATEVPCDVPFQVKF